MSKLNKYHLLSALSDGHYHSGQALAEQFGVSRAAIWNGVKHLERAGLPVQSVRGKGYQILHGVELLDHDTIRELLDIKHNNQIHQLMVLPEVTSTNDVLLQYQPKQSHIICLAECQTQGRGRFGRNWQSPLATNIYCSMLWKIEQAVESAAGLSLVVGIMLAELLQTFTDQRIQLKWPNDIVVGGKKLGGILIEMIGDANGPCHFVIGVGLNVRMPLDASVPHTDLYQLTGQLISRNQLAASILNRLMTTLPEFLERGLTAYLPQWVPFDALLNKQVQLKIADTTYTGVAQGIDTNGNLLLDIDGQQHAFNSGVATILKREL